MHGNQYLITDVLKGELGFTGFVVSDWDGDQPARRGDFDAAEVAHARSTPASTWSWCRTDRRLHHHADASWCSAGQIPMARIDDAVTPHPDARSSRFGLFEHPFADRRLHRRRSASPAHRAARPRRPCARSLVLLKNDGGVLPLAQDRRGSSWPASRADDIGAQCGGWTVGWQGAARPDHARHVASWPGIRARRRPGATVTFSGDGAGPEAAAADVNVAVVGEIPTPRGAATAHIPELTRRRRDAGQALKRAGKPVVLVVLTGRPLDRQHGVRRRRRDRHRLAARHRGRRRRRRPLRRRRRPASCPTAGRAS